MSLVFNSLRISLCTTLLMYVCVSPLGKWKVTKFKIHHLKEYMIVSIFVHFQTIQYRLTLSITSLFAWTLLLSNRFIITMDVLDQSTFVRFSILSLKVHGWYKFSKFLESNI